MTPPQAEKRILALDVRSRSFGFALFEGPKLLLDWGVKGFRPGVNAVKVPASKKLAALLDEFRVKTVVLNKRLAHRTRRRAALVGSILRQAEKHRIPVRFLTRRTVKNAYAGHDRNRHRIACVLTAEFPELAPKLPPKRRCQDNEDYRMSIFDAAALGVAYFARYSKRVPDTPLESRTPSQPS